jgi:hypothetical protein
MSSYGDNEKPREEEEPRYLGRRVENLGKNVHEWCERTGEGSSTHDLCKAHAEQLDRNPHRFDTYLKPYGTGRDGSVEPLGEDGWGGDVVHPNYDELSERCAIPDCRVLLGGW